MEPLKPHETKSRRRFQKATSASVVHRMTSAPYKTRVVKGTAHRLSSIYVCGK